MEYEKIKELMKDMENSKLSSLEIDFPDGTKISMKKEVVVEANRSFNENVEVQKEVRKTTVVEENVSEGNIIKSPMVGTFYAKPSPDSKPYVEVGKVVKKGDVVCIVEAMKLMNEIETEFDGEIVEIFVKDGEAVEYGKPLFRLK